MKIGVLHITMHVGYVSGSALALTAGIAKNFLFNLSKN